MAGKLSTPDVNFHIGAPGVASEIMKDLAKNEAVRKDSHTRILRAEEYRQFLRPKVNASKDITDLIAEEVTEQDRFWKRLSKYQVLAASQHAMLGHPKDVIRKGVILPDAAGRVERLCELFKGHRLDLHVTITRQSNYISGMPPDQLTSEDLEAPTGGVLSWLEFVSRIRAVSPDNQVLVWDFSDPGKVALPFAMAMLHFEEALVSKLKTSVKKSIEYRAVFEKIFDAYVPNDDICNLLDAQFEADLKGIEALPNTVVIRPSAVPKEFHIKMPGPA